MLIVLCLVKVSWASGGDAGVMRDMSRISLFMHLSAPSRRVLLFYPFETCWAFFKNGEYMMNGVDTAKINDGEHYELVYTKQ